MDLRGKKILLIQTAYPGDVLFSLPLATALKKSYPTAHLVGLTSRESIEVWSSQPCFDEVLVWDKRGRERGLPPLLRLGRKLKDLAFDTVLVAHPSLASAILGKLSGAPTRIGFRKYRALMTHAVSFPQDTFEGRYAGFFDLLGLDTLPPRFHVREDSIVRAEETLTQAGWKKAESLVALTFGSKVATKKWPVEYWSALIHELARARPNWVAILGSRTDHAEAESIRSAGGERCLNLTGLSVSDSAAVLRLATLVVGVESFGLHLARFVGIPRVIGLLGPTDPSAFLWRNGHRCIVHPDLACRPCTAPHVAAPAQCPLAHHRCMRELTPSQVLSLLSS